MARFYFVRHGEADYHLADERRLRGGARDWVPLTRRGEEQAHRLVEELRRLDLELIASSPMTRALHTAALLCRGLDLPLRVEMDLHEWLPDRGFGYDSTEVVLRRMDEMRAAGEVPEEDDHPWEHPSAVWRRVEDVLGRYAHYRRVALVTHCVVIELMCGRPAPPGGWLSYAEG